MATKTYKGYIAGVALVALLALFLLARAADGQAAAKCPRAAKASCKRDDYRFQSGKGKKAKSKAKKKGRPSHAVGTPSNGVAGATPVSGGSGPGNGNGAGNPTGPKTPVSAPPPVRKPVEEIVKPVEEVVKPVEEVVKPVEEVVQPVEEVVSDTCVSIAAIAQTNWAPSCWRPYSNTSPWNQPVSAGAPSAANSAAVVQRLTSWGPVQNLIAGNSQTGSDYYHPIYFATESDPVYTLEPTRRWGASPIAGESIPIPAEAQPADGGDAHMAVVTPSGWEYDFWAVESKPENGGVLRFGWGGKTRIDGDGLNSNATAAHFALAAGVIRAPELEAGHIDHALFMAVKCTDSGAATVYPAAPGTNDACSEQAGISNTNAPAMGSRFVLQMSDAEIAALPVPKWKKTILTAMADYGMYVGDAFGGQSWGLQFESGATYTSFGVEDPLAAFARREGVPTWRGQYVFDVNSGINWQSKLRVVAPCYTEGTC